MDQTMWRRGTRFALTELFVIIAGILVALYIDEWSSERADQRLEREYLEAIRGDLLSDLDELTLIREEIRARKEAAEILIAMNETSVPRTAAEQAELGWQIHRAGILRTFSASRASIEDLTSTGNLKLIRDRELRKSLIGYYNRVEDWKPYADWARKVIWEHYRPEMTNYLPVALIDLRRDFGDDGDDKALPPEVILGLIRNETFQRGIRNARGIAFFQERAIDGFEDRAKALITGIDEALGLSPQPGGN